MKRLIKKLQSLLIYLNAFGTGPGLRAFLRKRRKRGAIKLSIPGVKHPLHLRAGTSDLYMFEEVFIEGEYDLPTPLDPKTIIDVGANVGFASVWFANRYPNARIVAVEPDASNVEMLRKNVAPYPNVQVVQGALWYENTTLALDDNGDKSGIRVREGAGGVRAFTLRDLLAEAKATRADILKLDIEGAEKEVFERDASWLDAVGVLMIELHDRFKPGCSKALYTALGNHDFRELRHQTANWYVSGALAQKS
jgi:FkbM family methyltransferase